MGETLIGVFVLILSALFVLFALGCAYSYVRTGFWSIRKWYRYDCEQNRTAPIKKERDWGFFWFVVVGGILSVIFWNMPPKPPREVWKATIELGGDREIEITASSKDGCKKKKKYAFKEHTDEILAEAWSRYFDSRHREPVATKCYLAEIRQ